MRYAPKIALGILFICLTACSNLHLKEGIINFRAQNYRSAFIYLKPEALKGNPDAEYAVGYMYYYGQGVTENRKKAWFWINKAAAAGHPEAVAAAKILSAHNEPRLPPSGYKTDE